MIHAWRIGEGLTFKTKTVEEKCFKSFKLIAMFLSIYSFLFRIDKLVALCEKPSLTGSPSYGKSYISRKLIEKFVFGSPLVIEG